MKVLYAIQGTGNGHICRARDIIPVLSEKVELDLLVSGTQVDIDLPHKVKYRLGGLSFIFGKKGGVNLYQTVKRNSLRRFYREVKELPVEKYDLVINDFEPVSSWACRLKNVPCIGLSHQSAVLADSSPRASHFDPIGRTVLKYYAPSSQYIGFHFKRYNPSVYTPIIRSEVRDGIVSNRGHYTVYLPAYGNEQIFDRLSKVSDVTWHVFSKHSKETYVKGNVVFRPVNNGHFIKSMLSAEGVLCGAGFETPAEVLYLQKKLSVVPMRMQYEQQCNAQALREMGVPVFKDLHSLDEELLSDWVKAPHTVAVDYPDHTEHVVEKVLNHQLVTSNTITFKPKETKGFWANARLRFG